MATKQHLDIEIENCNNEIAIGINCMNSRNYDAAINHLRKAHIICHDSKKLHLKVHSMLVRVGWLRRSPMLFFSQTGLWVAAWLFD